MRRLPLAVASCRTATVAVRLGSAPRSTQSGPLAGANRPRRRWPAANQVRHAIQRKPHVSCQATEEGDVDAFEIRPDGRHRAAAGNGVNDELPVRFRFGDAQRIQLPRSFTSNCAASCCCLISAPSRWPATGPCSVG